MDRDVLDRQREQGMARWEPVYRRAHQVRCCARKTRPVQSIAAVLRRHDRFGERIAWCRSEQIVVAERSFLPLPWLRLPPLYMARQFSRRHLLDSRHLISVPPGRNRNSPNGMVRLMAAPPRWWRSLPHLLVQPDWQHQRHLPRMRLTYPSTDNPPLMQEEFPTSVTAHSPNIPPRRGKAPMYSSERRPGSPQ